MQWPMYTYAWRSLREEAPVAIVFVKILIPALISGGYVEWAVRRTFALRLVNVLGCARLIHSWDLGCALRLRAVPLAVFPPSRLPVEVLGASFDVIDFQTEVSRAACTLVAVLARTHVAVAPLLISGTARLSVTIAAIVVAPGPLGPIALSTKP